MSGSGQVGAEGMVRYGMVWYGIAYVKFPHEFLPYCASSTCIYLSFPRQIHQSCNSPIHPSSHPSPPSRFSQFPISKKIPCLSIRCEKRLDGDPLPPKMPNRGRFSDPLTQLTNPKKKKSNCGGAREVISQVSKVSMCTTHTHIHTHPRHRLEGCT